MENVKIDKDKLQELIIENSILFWWVPESKKKDLKLESLVEAILNYGTISSVRQLFDVAGIDMVAKIFFSQTKSKRTNYLPQTKHYFTLYFNKYAKSGS
ncbi:MAG: hypothetical protein PHH30_07465 [Bacteroidales bacterium]|nr:hypothetical protein [Bacteroidales bacterium]